MDEPITSNLSGELTSPNSFSRRVFVQGIGFVSLALLMGTFGGCEKIIEDIKNRPIRRRLRTGSAEVDADIAIYRDAVTAMKALPGSNPISWTAQAAIHGVSPCCFNFCEHGTDHFFDWHRVYLLYFERICQKLTNKPKFGLPYWNWNQNGAINPAFLDPASKLFQARGNTDLTGQSYVSNDELDPIMADTNFFSFMSQIEGTPHNQVHGGVGGEMGSYGSAIDPVFWTHHCMVDYCWAKWNIDLGNDTTNDPAWVNHVNSHIVDPDGNPVSMAAGLTTILPLLSYQYESSAIGSNPAVVAIKDFAKLEKRLKEGANIKFEVTRRVRLADKAAISIAKPMTKETRLSSADFSSIINADATKEKAFVSIGFAQLPPTSDFAVRVFINMPNANAGTPVKDPHYAGSFGFFGTTEPADKPGHKHQPKFLVNITNTLQRLKSSQQLKDGTPISVQLVPVAFDGTFEKADTQLMLEQIEIITTPVIVNPPRE
ncbi:MAG TPA: tyrosinase family protein [Pyrinomonadaceae bacterium]|nr:tyrosinase family protein [Pyrinomonadaceae bacterium]